MEETCTNVSKPTSYRLLPLNDDDSRTESSMQLRERAIKLLLKSIGENETREGLIRTPHRFAKAFEELCSGYGKTVHSVVGEGVFKSEGSGLVTVRNIEFFSLCEHHLLPFWGVVSVGYYPKRSILGLSKVARIVELFSRRLQVQERLTQEITEAISDAVHPRAVGVRVKASHGCMMMRGIQKQSSETVTENFKGMADLDALERSQLVASLGD